MEIVTDLTTLRKHSREVGEDDDLLQLQNLLLESLTDCDALGLSAVQIGILKRAIIIKARPGRVTLFIANPVIVKERGTQLGVEGCVSLPDVQLMVERPQLITVKGIDQRFIPVKYKLSWHEARIACHEIDHLDGVLITDKGTSKD